MRRIKRGDEVVVIAGRDRGRQGTVLRIVDDQRLVVEGINMVKKHRKPNPNRGETGGIMEIEAAIHVSNVQPLNSSTNKPDRVGFKILEDGRKVRYFKSNGEVLDA